MNTTPDIFLSYNREDQATARRFAEAFEAQGFKVWWDATLRSGEAYDEVTEKALREAKAVVVLWSKKSVVSRWVRAEATLADRNKTLVPAMIEPCDRPIMFELTQTADLSHWRGDANDQAWLSYLADVRRFIETAEPNRISPPIAPRRSRRLGRAGIATATVVLLGAGVVLWALNRTSGEEAVPSAQLRPERAPATALTSTPVTLAVLPFADLSPGRDQEYFSDGLAEELLNQLAQIEDLRVTARTSSFSFKGRNEDVRVIGEQLGVRNVLEGSVRTSGNRLRITAQLIDAADGTHKWSDSYDGELTDVFAVQEEIAMAVSRALSITLDVGETSRAKGGTTNLTAYDKFLRARALDRQRGGPSDIVEAARLYREAAALDPKFVNAWSALYTELANFPIYVPESASAARREMAEVSARLVSLAPNDWRTQAVRASEFMDQRKWSDAEAAVVAAMAAGASSATGTGIAFNTIFLLNVGRIREAAPFVARNYEADPLSLNASYAQQIMLFLSGRAEEAQAEYQRSRALAGDRALVDSFALFRVAARKDADPATMEALLRLNGPYSGATARSNRLLADSLGDEAAARGVMRRAFEDPNNQTATGIRVLVSLADYLGDKDLALAALRRSYVDLRGTNIGMIWQPFKTNLRADPRFKEILRDLGLIDYFRTSGEWGDFCQPLGDDDFECQ